MKYSERRERQSKVKPAGELIAKILDGYNLSTDVRIVRLHLEWPRLVGPRLAARTRPVGLREGRLKVLVWDASWMHQLWFIRDEIMGNINQRMGDPPLVSELDMKVGRVLPKNHIPHPTSEPSPNRRLRWRSMPAPADEERLAEIRTESAVIEDPELREQIIELRRRWNL